MVADSDNNCLTLDRMLQAFINYGYSDIELTEIKEFLKYFIAKSLQSFKNWHVSLNQFN